MGELIIFLRGIIIKIKLNLVGIIFSIIIVGIIIIIGGGDGEEEKKDLEKEKKSTPSLIPEQSS